MAAPNSDARIIGIKKLREQVLSQPVSDGIDIAEVAEYLGSLPLNRFASGVLQTRSDTPYIQPRGGVPLFESQRKLSLLLSEAGADFIPLTIDSYTRQNEYATAKELLERSEDEEKDYLNGYPLICHGHWLTRDLFTSIEKPISLRHGTPDARLLVEVALASGITDIEGGGICYCLPYSEGFPLDRSLLYWQYVDRICAISSTDDRVINRESFGPLTATMVPPAMVIVIEIIELLLAAEQGVKSATVSFGQTGSVIQDLATAGALRKLAREYLECFEFGDVDTYLAYHQWMGQFPTDRTKAAALINCSALIAHMIGADKIIVKTVDEARGIPSAQVNCEAVKAVRYIFDTIRFTESVGSPLIDTEAELIESEARTILEAIINLPGKYFWQSVYRAFQLGIIDIPFAPHCDNSNRLISMRDRLGSIRIAEAGNVPLTNEDLRAEQALLSARGLEAGKTYQQLLADINLMA